jgi:hypothetical protein
MARLPMTMAATSKRKSRHHSVQSTARSTFR